MDSLIDSDDFTIIELDTDCKELTSGLYEDNNRDDLKFDSGIADSGIDDSDLQKQSWSNKEQEEGNDEDDDRLTNFVSEEREDVDAFEFEE